MATAAHQRSSFGMLGAQARRKLGNDNDIKIVIQGSNSQTGIGKTTLAIQLCRFIDGNGWNAEEKAFINIRNYIDAHMEKPSGSALLLDEIEAGADSRRAMSQENVDLSQAWATLRARNIATVATLPSISMLDGRLLELADYWILVKKRGLAKPHKINVNDYAPKRAPQRQPLPGEEHIQFVDLPDGDADKEYLDEIKDEMLRGRAGNHLTKQEHEKELEQALREQRNAAIRAVYEQTDISQTALAEMEWVDISQSGINKMLKSS